MSRQTQRLITESNVWSQRSSSHIVDREDKKLAYYAELFRKQQEEEDRKKHKDDPEIEQKVPRVVKEPSTKAPLPEPVREKRQYIKRIPEPVNEEAPVKPAPTAKASKPVPVEPTETPVKRKIGRPPKQKEPEMVTKKQKVESPPVSAPDFIFKDTDIEKIWWRRKVAFRIPEIKEGPEIRVEPLLPAQPVHKLTNNLQSWIRNIT
jgi:hypothetical protein